MRVKCFVAFCVSPDKHCEKDSVDKRQMNIRFWRTEVRHRIEQKDIKKERFYFKLRRILLWEEWKWLEMCVSSCVSVVWATWKHNLFGCCLVCFENVSSFIWQFFFGCRTHTSSFWYSIFIVVFFIITITVFIIAVSFIPFAISYRTFSKIHICVFRLRNSIAFAVLSSPPERGALCEFLTGR